MSFEPDLSRYGDLTRSGGFTPGPATTLIDLIRQQWPDLKFPAHVALLPVEDLMVLHEDLRGQIITPHRDPFAIVITEAPRTPPPANWFVWVTRILQLAGIWLAVYGFWGLIQLAANYFRA
jgi:hypothetical protein